MLDHGRQSKDYDIFLNSLKSIEQHFLDRNMTPKVNWERDPQLFQGLNKEKQIQVLSRLVSFLDNMNDIATVIKDSGKNQEETDKFSRDEEIRFVQKKIWKEKYTIGDDFELPIDEGDIVEIYDLEGTQIYRNFEFFKVCNYSIVELLCSDWQSLFERPDYIISEMYNCVDKLVKNNKPGIFCFTETGTHLNKHRFLDDNSIFEVELKKIVPLFKNKKVSAVLTTMQAKHILSNGLKILSRFPK